MPLSRKKITEDLIEMLLSWRHSGFNVFCGPKISPHDEKPMDNLARYIVRASFFQERMIYLPAESKLVYRSKDGKEEKAFDALEWLAAMCAHVPNKGEKMVTAPWTAVNAHSYAHGLRTPSRLRRDAQIWLDTQATTDHIPDLKKGLLITSSITYSPIRRKEERSKATPQTMLRW